MGFGGGGFSPSPGNVAGPTEVGSELSDVHQFTGSVDITGSLEINGVQITTNGGGGGGATSPGGSNTQVQYNNAGSFAGSANMVFNGTSLTATQMTASVSMKAATLQVSSSAEGALFRVDHSTQTGAKPIIYVTGSGLVGIGTAAPRTDTPPASGPTPGDDTNRVHILGESGTDQGQDPVINSVLMLENDNHVGIQFMFPNGRAGQLTWGTNLAQRKATFYYDSNYNKYCWEGTSYGATKVMDLAAGGDCLNIGSSNAKHMQGIGSARANLHISSSTAGVDTGGPVLLRIDHGSQVEPVLYVTGSGRVGIGTESVLATLHVSSSTASNSLDLFRIDHKDHADNPIFVVTGSGRVGIGTATPSAVLDVHPDNGAGSNEVKFRGSNGTSHFYYSAAEHTYIRGGKQTSTVFIADARNTGGSDNQKCIIGNATSTTAQLHVSSSDNSTVMSVTSNSGSILTAQENQQVLFGGTYGATTIETLTSNGAISATTSTTILNLTAQSNNTLYNFTIADGSFTGQEKKIYAMATSGSSGPNSNSVMIAGANIRSKATNGILLLSGSMQDFGGGPSWYFTDPQAGASLVWDSAKWLIVGNNNFSISSS